VSFNATRYYCGDGLTRGDAMMNGVRLLITLVLVAAPLAAQKPMMEGSMMHEMGPAMMKMMLYAPQHLLARKDALDLTADQVTRLTTLRDGTKAAHEAAMSEAKTHMGAIEQAADAVQPDTAALKSHFQSAHQAMGRAHWAMLASAAQARAVLTDAQRAKVEVWADSMEAWRRQHRQMMPPHRLPEKDHP
jgi:Spy/CpxP family protein refolding chaperone